MAIIQELKVSPEDLKAQAKQIDDTVGRIRQSLLGLSRTIGDTNSYWRGEAADKHRKDMTDRQQEIQRVIGRLEAYHKDILSMAGIYIETRDANVQISNQLKPKIEFV